MVYAIDIDNTLCKGNDFLRYEQAEPIQDAIDKVNALFGQDHMVILWTARFEQDRKVTTDWLSRHAVRYHRLLMGKFRADVYVDNDSKRMDEL